MTLRHNSIMFLVQVCIFVFPAKMHALFVHTCTGCRNCVAAIGAMRFSVRGFGCALFYFREEDKNETNRDFGVNDMFVIDSNCL